MIKFYKGDYGTISGKISGSSNICFVTDRQVLYMGGLEYGKDQFKSVADATALATEAAKVADGTIFFVESESALYKKTTEGNAVTTTKILDIPAQIQAASDAISATISTAFDANKVVIGTATGITASDFVIDTTSGELTGITTELSSTLVNAATLSAAVTAINQANATVAGGDGVAVTTGQATAAGTEYTVAVDLATGNSNTLSIDGNGKLTDNLALSAITTAQGYAASYALINTKNNEQLGSAINIAKSRLLKAASYVAGTEDAQGNVTEITTNIPASANRYLKLVFWTDDNGDGTQGAGENDEVVYINVNELFDSYTSGNGIIVDPATNTISINRDSNSESFLSVDADGLKVTGIQTAINSAIQGLGSEDAVTNQYVTAFGVDANGALTGTTAQVSAAQVVFDPSQIDSLTATTVQAAIAELAADLGDGIDALDVSQIGDSTTYIQYISETDGKISAQSATLDASKVAYAHTGFGATVSQVSGALDNIYSYLSGLDYTQTATGTAPSSGTGNKLNVVATVGEADGLISATTLELTAGNTYAAGITAVPGTQAGVAADTVRVGITEGSQAGVNDQFSNLFADYMSFHDGTDKVIS